MPPLPNPFRPTAGATPPELIGRQGMLDESEYGLRLGSGAPGLLTIITGACGIGKTVLLSEAKEKGRQQGWIVISETATPGLLGRIGETMRLQLEELGPGPAGRRITALGVAGFTVTTSSPARRPRRHLHRAERRSRGARLRGRDCTGQGLHDLHPSGPGGTQGE